MPAHADEIISNGGPRRSAAADDRRSSRPYKVQPKCDAAIASFRMVRTIGCRAPTDAEANYARQFAVQIAMSA